MLKTLTRLHTPELLHVLASMGHGDELVLVDCHFPARAQAGQARRGRPSGRAVGLPSADAARHFREGPALWMEIADAPDEIPEVQKIRQQVIDKWECRHVPFAGIERHAFYERSR
jgi:L-fucose mutarotase